jgi:hypothetical protein
MAREQAEDAAGADLPQFVKDEFDAFLECGILAHGFLRLHCGDCGDCGHDKLVAFGCKRRGLQSFLRGPAQQLHLIRFGVRITSLRDVSGLPLRKHGVSVWGAATYPINANWPGCNDPVRQAERAAAWASLRSIAEILV